MWYYFRTVYDYLYATYCYFCGRCKKDTIIPFDPREKIYERDPILLNQILNYYRYDKFGRRVC